MAVSFDEITYNEQTNQYNSTLSWVIQTLNPSIDQLIPLNKFVYNAEL